MNVTDLYRELCLIPDGHYEPSALTKLIRAKIKKHLPAKVKTYRQPEAGNEVAISGQYDAEEDTEGYTSVSLFVVFGPDVKEVVLLHDDKIQLAGTICEVLLHELTHQAQGRQRKFARCKQFVTTDSDPHKQHQQQYLGSPDEVEAFGVSIAVQLFLRKNAKTVTVRNINSLPEAKWIFKDYCKAFGRNHIVVRQLLEYASKYIIHLGEHHVRQKR